VLLRLDLEVLGKALSIDSSSSSGDITKKEFTPEHERQI
jgi:hypothetical protein